MSPFAYLILCLSLIHMAIAKECAIQDPEIVAWEKKLKKDLKKDIEIFEPPTNNCNQPIVISMRFVMKYFTFDSSEETFTVQTWIFMRWQDDRLKWKPEDYHGITETEISSSSIWTPSTRLNNTINTNDYDRFFYVPCQLKNTGKVACVLRSVHDVRCAVKRKNWPHDKQDCSLDFGVWGAYTKNSSFKLNVSSRAINMFGAEYGGEWFISDYKQEFDEYTQTDIKMIFTLVREATGLSAIVIYPSVILTTLTVASLFLDVRNYVRIGLTFFTMVVHFNFLLELAENIPTKSFDIPTLLLYYRGSTILTTMNIMFCVILAQICKKHKAPHNFVNSVNTFVYEKYGRFYLLPKWHSETDLNIEEDDVKFNQDWVKFANIVNWMFALIIIVTYMCMYAAFVPQPVPEKN